MQNNGNVVLETDQRPELVFALVGAIGTDQTKVTDQLMASLSRYGYETAEPIHLIERVHDFPRWESRDKYPESPYDLRAESHMTMGDEFRETCDDSSALALLGINYIRGKIRPAIDPEGEGRRPLPSLAYVFRSLKHQDEVNLLRRIYQPNLFVIGTYNYREQRISRLSERIAGSHQSARPGDYRSQAEYLNKRDQVEIGKKFGQNVEKSYPLADIFIDCSSESTSQESIDRLTDLIFGHPYRTPSRDEFAMFHAQGAALRSSDMSRQVGAVIAGDEGEVVAMGTNEVPKTGGGQYWEDDEDDYRDHKVGYESNTKLRHMLLAELIGLMKERGWLNEEKEKIEASDLAATALEDDSIIRRAQLVNITEFGRTVHAEMAALMDAALRGVSVKDMTLYTTTFPCHMCAKHIVAAGIRRVVYIEPYPKSLSQPLYIDSIEVEAGSVTDRIPFDPFIGIAPRRYVEMFSAPENRKKSDGSTIPWVPGKDKEPKVGIFDLAVAARESVALEAITEKFEELMGEGDGNESK